MRRRPTHTGATHPESRGVHDDHPDFFPQCRDRGPRRRLFLVPRSGVRRALRRAVGRIGLRRRAVGEPELRGRLQRPNGSCGSGPDLVRSCRALVPGPPHRVLHDPRPDDDEPPGQRRRHAVPLGDLLPDADAATHGGNRDRRARRPEALAERHRYRNRGCGAVLSCRGLPPALLRTQSRRSPTARWSSSRRSPSSASTSASD